MIYWTDKPELSRFAQKIDRWYNFDHFWRIIHVQAAVKMNRITKEEYSIITGFDYDTGKPVVKETTEDTTKKKLKKTTSSK